MEFFNNLSLGYQIMLIGIIAFVIGIVIVFFEGLSRRRSSKQIKDDYMIKNNVRSSDNPLYKKDNLSVNPQVTNTVTNISDLNKENNSDLMDMFK